MKHLNIHIHRYRHTVVNIDQVIYYPIEFLSSFNPSGLPLYELTLKIGTPIMPLWNFQTQRLCNGTRQQSKTI